MKIGIYGDSYGCYLTKWDEGLTLNEHLGLSWVEILESRGHEITNFSVVGSAFMYSYEKFVENYKNFDLNIFIATSWTRVYIKSLGKIKLFGYRSPVEETEKLKNLPPYEGKEKHLKILGILKEYFDHCMDWDLLKITQHGLVNNLWYLAPNTLVIPVDDESIPEKPKASLNDVQWGELSLISKKEFDNLKWNLGYHCYRKCHFSPENNAVVADMVLDAIANSKRVLDIDLSLIKKPSKAFSAYAKPRNQN